jgi:hypothetical protein
MLIKATAKQAGRAMLNQATAKQAGRAMLIN